MQVVFCHGLESGPHGRKYHAMVEAGLDVLSPDFRGQKLAERVSTLLDVIGEDDPPLIGSSYGGLVAVCVAMELARSGRTLPGMLLYAPALHRLESPASDVPLRAHCPVHILHGLSDRIVPIEASRQFAADNAELVTLDELDDDHSLTASMDRVVREAMALRERCQALKARN